MSTTISTQERLRALREILVKLDWLVMVTPTSETRNRLTEMVILGNMIAAQPGFVPDKTTGNP